MYGPRNFCNFGFWSFIFGIIIAMTAVRLFAENYFAWLTNTSAENNMIVTKCDYTSYPVSTLKNVGAIQMTNLVKN